MDLSVGPSSSSSASTMDQHGGALTPGQMSVLIILERTGAGLSMAAIVLTVLSYIAFPKLRTTPNLFLLCASGANAGASCASMMGYAGMHEGLESGLCQAQAFIFQWCVRDSHVQRGEIH
jgi:heme O synthase-like polyprenyltransferase